MIIDILAPQNFIFSPDAPVQNEFAVQVTNDSNETRRFVITALVARGDTWVNFCWLSGKTGTFQGGNAWGYFRQSDYRYGRSYNPICIYDLQARNYFNAKGEVPKISQLDSADWKTWSFSQAVDIPAGKTVTVPFTFTVKWADIAFLNQIFAVLIQVTDGVDIAYKEKYIEGKKCTGRTYITDVRVKNLNIQAGTMDVEFDVQSDCGESKIFNMIMKHPTKGYLGRLYQLIYPPLNIGKNTFTFHYSDADWGIQTIKDAVEMGGADIVVGVSIGNIFTCEQGGVGDVVCKTVSITVGPPKAPNIVVESVDVSPAQPAAGDTVKVTAVVTNTGNASGSANVQLYVNDVPKAGQIVSLNPGQSETLTWTIGPLTEGTFDIKVCV